MATRKFKDLDYNKNLINHGYDYYDEYENYLKKLGLDYKNKEATYDDTQVLSLEEFNKGLDAHILERSGDALDGGDYDFLGSSNTGYYNRPEYAKQHKDYVDQYINSSSQRYVDTRLRGIANKGYGETKSPLKYSDYSHGESIEKQNPIVTQAKLNPSSGAPTNDYDFAADTPTKGADGNTYNYSDTTQTALAEKSIPAPEPYHYTGSSQAKLANVPNSFTPSFNIDDFKTQRDLIPVGSGGSVPTYTRPDDTQLYEGGRPYVIDPEDVQSTNILNKNESDEGVLA